MISIFLNKKLKNIFIQLLITKYKLSYIMDKCMIGDNKIDAICDICKGNFKNNIVLIFTQIDNKLIYICDKCKKIEKQ